jgi:hypothetical protein
VLKKCNQKTLHEWGIEGTSTVEEKLVLNSEDKRDISYLEFSVKVNRLVSFVNLLVLFFNFFCSCRDPTIW